jgi:hypothetical protein
MCSHGGVIPRHAMPVRDVRLAAAANEQPSHINYAGLACLSRTWRRQFRLGR